VPRRSLSVLVPPRATAFGSNVGSNVPEKRGGATPAELPVCLIRLHGGIRLDCTAGVPGLYYDPDTEEFETVAVEPPPIEHVIGTTVRMPGGPR
jgi:hypothetical protein